MLDIKLIISSILIFISFFIWYTFWNEKSILEIKELNDKLYYVNLEITKTKIDISKPENVIIKINWEETNSWSLDIK